MTQEMSDKLYEIGDKEGLTGKMLDDYVNFFVSRFDAGAMYGGYPNEWAQRFSRNGEWGAADRQSRSVLLNVNPMKYKDMPF